MHMHIIINGHKPETSIIQWDDDFAKLHNQQLISIEFFFFDKW